MARAASLLRMTNGTKSELAGSALYWISAWVKLRPSTSFTPRASTPCSSTEKWFVLIVTFSRVCSGPRFVDEPPPDIGIWLIGEALPHARQRAQQRRSLSIVSRWL